MRTSCCGVMREGQCTDCPLTAPIRPYPLPPHQLGWQCPKCGRGNAPFVHTCPCGPNTVQTTGTRYDTGTPHEQA